MSFCRKIWNWWNMIGNFCSKDTIKVMVPSLKIQNYWNGTTTHKYLAKKLHNTEPDKHLDNVIIMVVCLSENTQHNTFFLFLSRFISFIFNSYPGNLMQDFVMLCWTAEGCHQVFRRTKDFFTNETWLHILLAPFVRWLFGDSCNFFQENIYIENLWKYGATFKCILKMHLKRLVLA